MMQSGPPVSSRAAPLPLAIRAAAAKAPLQQQQDPMQTVPPPNAGDAGRRTAAQPGPAEPNGGNIPTEDLLQDMDSLIRYKHDKNYKYKGYESLVDASSDGVTDSLARGYFHRVEKHLVQLIAIDGGQWRYGNTRRRFVADEQAETAAATFL